MFIRSYVIPASGGYVEHVGGGGGANMGDMENMPGEKGVGSHPVILLYYDFSK